MNKAHLDLLKKNYKDACNAFLKAFSDKYEVCVDEQDWVAGDVGGIVGVNDEFYINMEDIILMLDKDISWEEFLEWWDYCMDVALVGIVDSPNLKSWHMGYHGKISKEELKRLVKRQKDFEETIRKYNKKDNSF